MSAADQRDRRRRRRSTAPRCSTDVTLEVRARRGARARRAERRRQVDAARRCSAANGDPDAGTVTLDGRAARRATRRSSSPGAASVLTQENTLSFPFRVREVRRDGPQPVGAHAAARRRRPGAGRGCRCAPTSRHLARPPLHRALRRRAARVSLARVLAQDTAVVFLDEPTAALDLRHQEDVLRVGARARGRRARGRGGAARPLARGSLRRSRRARLASRPPRRARAARRGAHGIRALERLRRARSRSSSATARLLVVPLRRGSSPRPIRSHEASRTLESMDWLIFAGRRGRAHRARRSFAQRKGWID